MTSATEVLRRMLDERGVEWGFGRVERRYTAWVSGGWHMSAKELADGSLLLQAHSVAHFTPAQAIAATLGETPTPPPPTPPKQPPYDELIESLRRDWGIDVSWDGLRRFWYVGLNEKGMRMRDERDATLGRGTCKVEYVSDWMGWHCKACDVLWQGLRDQRPRFCLNCGAEVVDE